MLRGGTPTVTKHYFGNGQRVAQRSTGGGLLYYHTDHLGSSVRITNGVGELVSVHRYTPYGSEIEVEIPPGTPENLLIDNVTINTTEDYKALDTITVGSSVTIESQGDAMVTAGKRVVIKAGFKVKTGATVHIGINPGLGEPKLGGEIHYLYTGKEKDSSGLYYYGARYYDPELGRFISADPLLDGLNRYTYCYNNPVIYIDPSGEFVHIIIGAVVGGIIGGVNAGMHGENVFWGVVFGAAAGAAGAWAGGVVFEGAYSLLTNLGVETLSAYMAAGTAGGIVGGGIVGGFEGGMSAYYKGYGLGDSELWAHVGRGALIGATSGSIIGGIAGYFIGDSELRKEYEKIYDDIRYFLNYGGEDDITPDLEFPTVPPFPAHTERDMSWAVERGDSLRGTPYGNFYENEFGGNRTVTSRLSMIDCTEFISYSYKTPLYRSWEFHNNPWFREVSYPRRGDVVIWIGLDTKGDLKGHAAIYTGEGGNRALLHATESKGVRYTSVATRK